MTQNEYVLKCLTVFGTIDSRNAARVGITRLAARVKNLRDLGVPIITRRKSVSTHWENKRTYVAEYHLDKSL